MAGHRRTHLLLVLLLALGGIAGAAGAYVGFGPSASRAPVIFSATGHGQVGEGVGYGPGHAEQHPSHQRHGVTGHGHGHVAMTGHGHGHVAVSGHGRPPKPHHPGGGHGNKRFGVAVGDATGLFPGSTTPIPVSYTNPNPFPITVTRVTVSTPGTSACGPRYFVTGTYEPAAPVRIPGRRSVDATVPFGMKRSAPDSCQAVSLTVDVSAQAVKS